MFNKPHWLALGVALALVLILWSLPEQAAARVKQTAGSVFVPVFGLTSSATKLTSDAMDAIMPRGAMLKELRNLRLENQQLRLQVVQGEEALRENARYRQLIGWQQRSLWRHRFARVIARDPANWWRTLRIDVGSRDGVKPDLPVVTPEGLVGRVGAVGYATSQVILVGDPKCRVAVVVRETGENGVLSSSSSSVLDHRLVDLTHLPRSTALKPGQTVQTSGLGGIFPAGIPAGLIVDSRTVGFGLYTEARVKLAVDSSKLNELMVLFP